MNPITDSNTRVAICIYEVEHGIALEPLSSVAPVHDLGLSNAGRFDGHPRADRGTSEAVCCRDRKKGRPKYTGRRHKLTVEHVLEISTKHKGSA